MTKIQLRRDTSVNWTQNNPIPSSGEPCYETDTGKLKIGNGNTPYNSLPYIGNNSSGGGGSADITDLYQLQYGTESGSIPVTFSGNNITLKSGILITTPNGTFSYTSDITYQYTFETERTIFAYKDGSDESYYNMLAVYYGGSQPATNPEGQIAWFDNNVWKMISATGEITTFSTQLITPIAKVYLDGETIKSIDYGSFYKISTGVTDAYTKAETDELLDKKQDNLTAGQGITINNNVISASAQEIFVIDGGNEYTPNINTVLPVTEVRDIVRTDSSSGDTTIGYINSFLNYRPTESEVIPVFDLSNSQITGGPTGYAVLCFTTGADVTNLQFLGYETYHSRRVWITNGTISGKTELPVEPFTKYYLRFRYAYAGDPGNEWGMQISPDNQTWSTEVASGIRKGAQDLRLGYCNNSSLTGLPFQGTFHLDECVSENGAYAYNPATGENSFEGYNVKAKDNEETILQGVLYSKDGKNISVIRDASSIYGRALLFDSNTQSFKNGGYIHCNFNLLNKRLGDTATYNLFNLFPSYNTFISNSGGMTIQSGAEIVKFGAAQVNAANDDLINFDLTLSCIPTSSTNQYRMDIVLKNLTQGLENTNFFTFNNANNMMSLVMYPMLRESSNARTLFVSNLICESYASNGERE